MPKLRSLDSAVSGRGAGKVRVVCQGRGGWKSLGALAQSIDRRAQARLPAAPEPAQAEAEPLAGDAAVLGELRARSAVRVQRDPARGQRLAQQRPRRGHAGRLHRADLARAAAQRPALRHLTQEDSSGAKTPSYRYQVTCPNDQNLIHIQGRAVPDTPPPSPPLKNRQGIPDLGPCVRCNFQLEGSGVQPTDVIIDGASDYESDDPEARPHTSTST